MAATSKKIRFGWRGWCIHGKDLHLIAANYTSFLCSDIKLTFSHPQTLDLPRSDLSDEHKSSPEGSGSQSEYTLLLIYLQTVIICFSLSESGDKPSIHYISCDKPPPPPPTTTAAEQTTIAPGDNYSYVQLTAVII